MTTHDNQEDVTTHDNQEDTTLRGGELHHPSTRLWMQNIWIADGDCGLSEEQESGPWGDCGR